MQRDRPVTLIRLDRSKRHERQPLGIRTTRIPAERYGAFKMTTSEPRFSSLTVGVADSPLDVRLFDRVTASPVKQRPDVTKQAVWVGLRKSDQIGRLIDDIVNVHDGANYAYLHPSQRLCAAVIHTVPRASIRLVAVALIALAACGGDDDDDTSGTGATSPASSSSAPTATTSPVTTSPTETTAVPAPSTESTASETTVPSTGPTLPTSDDPCTDIDPSARLVENQLNDRCSFNLIGADEPLPPGVAKFELTCSDGIVIDLVAAPQRLLLSVDDPSPGSLDEALAALVDLAEGLDLALLVEDVEQIGDTTAVVPLRDPLPEDFVQTTLLELQGDGFSVDLDYLEPVLPNDAFRPTDDAEAAGASETTQEGGEDPNEASGRAGARVLVLDSTDDPAGYDVFPGNNKPDEDHGHGAFVTGLIERLAPSASVTLQPVEWQDLAPGRRWSPMWFNDSDIIRALQNARAADGEDPYNIVNLSLGGPGCPGAAMRLNLLQELVHFQRSQGNETVFLAAAGNDGAMAQDRRTTLHFPAALRNVEAFDSFANDISAATGSTAAGDHLMSLVCELYPSIHAVGSGSSGAPESYSNIGDWIDLWANGTDQISRYPFYDGGWTEIEAKWSGTSFATARATAAFASGWSPGQNPWADVESVPQQTPAAC